MKQTDYLRRLRGRMIRSALFAALGLGLTVLGFSMRLLHLDRPESFHNAWQMFAVLSALLMTQALSRFFAARRVLKGPDFYREKSRIEEEDERTAHIDALAWSAMARFFNVLLFAAMLLALALEIMEVFWVCWAQTLLLNGGCLLLRWWYGRRL